MIRDPDLARPLADAPGLKWADVVQARVHEGAVNLDDVVERRKTYRSWTSLDRLTTELAEPTAITSPRVVRT